MAQKNKKQCFKFDDAESFLALSVHISYGLFRLVHNIGSIRLHHFSFVKELLIWSVLFDLVEMKLVSKNDLSIRCKLYSIHVPDDILLSLKSGTTFTRAFQSQKDENW